MKTPKTVPVTLHIKFAFNIVPFILWNIFYDGVLVNYAYDVAMVTVSRMEEEFWDIRRGWRTISADG